MHSEMCIKAPRSSTWTPRSGDCAGPGWQGELKKAGSADLEDHKQVKGNRMVLESRCQGAQHTTQGAQRAHPGPHGAGQARGQGPESQGLSGWANGATPRPQTEEEMLISEVFVSNLL